MSNRTPIPDRYRPLADRVKRGSRAAAIKLHCLECVGYQSAEVNRCCAPECALYAFRTGKFVGSGTPKKRVSRPTDFKKQVLGADQATVDSADTAMLKDWASQG